MNQKQIAILKQNLTLKDGQPVTTSLKVAESFDRRHDHILDAIKNLECSPEFCLLNFRETVHFRPSPLNGAPIPSPYFELTKNGFLFLAMGFTGQKAATLREGYIRAFDEMAAELASGTVRTREELTDRLMMVVADAARQGYEASFIPELVRFRRLGLTQAEIGRIFGMPSRTVCTWTKKISDAGVDLPLQTTRKTTVFFKKLHEKREKQLHLPFAGGRQ